MKIIYIADDGTQFNDEFECKDYEWKLHHPYLKDVHCYDKDDNELQDIFSEDTYGDTVKIIVFNNKAVKDLQDLSIYTGFCCYENISECGEWIFDDEIETFVKC